VAAQTEADASRIRQLGAPRVVVTGSIKFDVTIAPAMIQLGQALRACIGNRPVLLCASTREGEETLLLAQLAAILQPRIESALSSGASSGVPPVAPLLLLVPRHPQRFDEVARLVEQQGLRLQRRSQLDLGTAPATPTLSAQTQVLLGDSMGEMFAYYTSCDIAFIGGSLLPLGGQNLIEACALGKPVLLGPHMFNFAEISEHALAAGAALQVSDAADLAQQIQSLLADGMRMEKMGALGAAFARQHQGATGRTIASLGQFLPD
jgi:3-deoxy-D-manno-octulosonic-acid transferase